jgi:mycothiol synthase
MQIVDASRLTEDEFARALDLRQLLDRTVDPDMEPTGATELRLWLTVCEIEDADHDFVVAFDGTRAVALGHLERTRDPANFQLAFLEIECLDDDIADTRPVLDRLLDLAEADGRTSILAFGDLTDARDGFWSALGATRRQEVRQSDLILSEVDPALMRAWVEGHEERAASVELVQWKGNPPDEHLDAVVAAYNAMNDAPRDGIDMDDFVYTPDRIAHETKAWAALGYETHGMVAVEEDGSAAGLTTVLVNTHRPEASWQGDTGVLERHRRRGIGRWIKAAMWFHLRENAPHVPRLRTGNAESNDAMLAINVEMGFRPAHVSGLWQADMSTLRASLAA